MNERLRMKIEKGVVELYIVRWINVTFIIVTQYLERSFLKKSKIRT